MTNEQIKEIIDKLTIALRPLVEAEARRYCQSVLDPYLGTSDYNLRYMIKKKLRAVIDEELHKGYVLDVRINESDLGADND